MAIVGTDWIDTENIPAGVSTSGLYRFSGARFERRGLEAIDGESFGNPIGKMTFVFPELEPGRSTPDPVTASTDFLRKALFALVAMNNDRGSHFRLKVSEFIARFSPLPPLLAFYEDNLHDPRMWVPDLVRRSILMTEHVEPISMHGVPLFVYSHEAKNVSSILDLYIALCDDDKRGLERWFRCHHPGSFAFRSYFKQHPDQVEDQAMLEQMWTSLRRAWKRAPEAYCRDMIPDAWGELESLLRPYVSTFIGIRMGMKNGTPEEPADKTPAGVYNDQLRFYLEAKTMIGGIYAYLLQIIAEQRMVKACYGCGQLFLPARTNQAYHDQFCANRSRVRRHRERNSGGSSV